MKLLKSNSHVLCFMTLVQFSEFFFLNHTGLCSPLGCFNAYFGGIKTQNKSYFVCFVVFIILHQAAHSELQNFYIKNLPLLVTRYSSKDKVVLTVYKYMLLVNLYVVFTTYVTYNIYIFVFYGLFEFNLVIIIKVFLLCICLSQIFLLNLIVFPDYAIVINITETFVLFLTSHKLPCSLNIFPIPYAEITTVYFSISLLLLTQIILLFLTMSTYKSKEFF